MTDRSRELRPESAAEARRDLEDERRSLPPAPSVGTLVPEISVHPIPSTPGRATTVTIPRTREGRRRGRPRRVLRWAFGTLVALAAIAAAAWGAWTYLLPHRVDVPRVVGMTVEEATDRLEDARLVVREAEGEYSGRFEEGLVLRVVPAERSTLEEGDRVTIVPSLGPEPVPVPDVLGKTLPRARALLREGDLAVGRITREYSDDVAAGRVISVDAGEEAPFGSDIDVVLSKGPFPVPVPRVTRLTEDEAIAVLEADGFVVSVSSEYSDTVPRGEVVSQDPSKNTELQPGTTVTILVSLGPPVFTMPDVVGMSRDAAVARLRELGAVVDVVLVRDPGATVVFQEPGVGATVHVGATVEIYVA
jgi:serine/threonine-protein kinase